MVSYNTITNEELINILKTYMDPKYWKLHDWDTILETAEINNNEVWFKLAFFTLGLDYDTLEYRDVININGFE
jgi:hypothetical protein